MAGSVGRESRTPIFNGENYELWRIRMKTILISYGIWELVEEGVPIPNPKGKKKETETSNKSLLSELLKQDAKRWISSKELFQMSSSPEFQMRCKALDLIQGAVSDELIPRISNEVTAKGAWDLLQQEYRGDERVRSVKLQGLRRDFEYTRMREDESLYTKDLDTIEVQEVVATLKVFEQRLERHSENIVEKAFASMSMKGANSSSSAGSGQSKKNWKNKGKKWEDKPNSGGKNENWRGDQSNKSY
ncbi:uncharacterized protein LOC110744442 [Prunus avium]|uniref:Uncharacterized protein LOC110744442 n=1 Tax=Prunus avium TaxID=42229 RepID=A0A6P5R541_PRUAV|nr:uncharacterized protein LOC110744442 [Prunus avium]